MYEEDLRDTDVWLNALTDDELSLVCDGEETEVAEFMKERGAPGKTQGLLNDLFEHV